MPVNPYNDRKISLRRSYGNLDLDIIRASYSCRKANVTELGTHYYFRIIVLYKQIAIFRAPECFISNDDCFSYLFSVDCLS